MAAIAVFSAFAAGCGKSATRAAPAGVAEEAPAPSLPCPAQAEILGAWLRDLAADGHVPSEAVLSRADAYRYLSRPLPIVPLARLAEPPSRLPDAAMISLHRGGARFGDLGARVSDPDALGSVLGDAAGSALSPSFGFGGLGRFYMFHSVNVLVSERERWADVVRFFEGAAHAGFNQLRFVFEVIPRARAPRPSAALRVMTAIAADAQEMPWKRDVAAEKELARRNESCAEVARPFAKQAHDSGTVEAQLQAFVVDTPSTLRGCACRADIAAIEAFAWVRFGRHWGPTTVSHQIEVAPPGERAETIDASAEAPWRDVATKVVDASNRKASVRFAVTGG